MVAGRRERAAGLDAPSAQRAQKTGWRCEEGVHKDMNGMTTITVELPESHAKLLEEICADYHTKAGIVVAQALATLHAIHIGAWRVEVNYNSSELHQRDVSVADERRLRQPNDLSGEADCPDCIAAKKLAWSDFTTPGFFHATCEKHRPPTALVKDPSE